MGWKGENYLKKARETKIRNKNCANFIMNYTNCSKLYTKKQYLYI